MSELCARVCMLVCMCVGDSVSVHVSVCLSVFVYGYQHLIIVVQRVLNDISVSSKV